MLGRFVLAVGDRLLKRPNRWLARAGVTSQVMHGLELASALACAGCLAEGLILPAIALLALHGLFDYLDGGIRRAAMPPGPATIQFPYLHAVVDKISDSVLFLALAWNGSIGWGLSLAALSATFAATVLGFWGQAKWRLRREACMFDRSDRILLLLILSPFSLFMPAVLGATAMSLVVVAERVRSILYCGLDHPEHSADREVPRS
jgi:phosphatidylglycerophosphate synthase